MIEKLYPNPINLQASSVYSFNEFSLQELLNKFFQTINECVESSNKALDFVRWLKEEGLPPLVEKEIDDMYNDGRLEALILKYTNGLDERVKNNEKEIISLQNQIDDNNDETHTVVSKIDGELKQKANKDTNIFRTNTYGTFSNASNLSVITNDLNGDVEVMGIRSTSQLSKYKDRDSVSLFLSNRGRNSTININEGTIYTTLSVKIDNSINIDFSKILKGMIIDTKHEPYGYTSIIDNVDNINRIINVKDGWYQKTVEGSTVTEIPLNGVGLEINKLSKIWNLNTNLILDESSQTENGVGFEMDLLRRKSNSAIGGFDVVNYNKKASFGYKVRKTDSAEGGFTQGFYARDCDTAFFNQTTKVGDVLLQSQINGSQEQGFLLTNEGLQTKLKLLLNVITDGTIKYNNYATKIYMINKTKEEGFELPNPSNLTGEIIFIYNYSPNVDIPLTCGKQFIVNSTAYSKVTILKKTSMIMLSDGMNWYVLNGNFKEVTNSFSGLNINGQLRLNGGSISSLEMGSTDGTISSTFIDLHSSGSNNDYDVRLLSTGGDNSNGKGIFNIYSNQLKLNDQLITSTIIGNGTPSISPNYVGQEYIDTTNKKVYKSFGQNIADWVIIN